MLKVRERGETVVAKDRPFYIERHGVPETVYFDISYSPVSDEHGHVLAVLCIVNETTERVGYESTLKRLASIISSSEDAILGIDLDMTVTDWNSGAEKLYGFSAPEIVGRSVTLLVPDDRIDEEARIISRIKAGERVDTPVRRHSSGRLLDVSLTVSPIYDADGRIVGASKIARDITARKEAERVQDLLIGELNHRVKNVLATVAAIARQTFTGAQEIEAERTAFDARLQSLARAHDLLRRGRWEAAGLRTAVNEALSAYPPEHFEVGGPDVDVSPKAVLGLALILHEVATNAAKYGALAVSSGTVSVSWEVSPSDARLIISWKETGGPQVAPPTRKGFGSRLIHALSAGQLGGNVQLDFDACGVRCMIVVPLVSGWSDHAVAALMYDTIGLPSDHLTYRMDDTRWIIRLAEKTTNHWKGVCAHCPMTGCDDDFDRRPTIPNRGCELQAIHTAWHIDIGEHQTDFRVGIENNDCVIRVRCLQHCETVVLQGLNDIHSDKNLVLHDKNRYAVVAHHRSSIVVH